MHTISRFDSDLSLLRRGGVKMKHITNKPFVVITSKYGVLTVGYETLKSQRLVWTCADLDVYVVGPLTGVIFEQAGNLALQECCNRNIPARWLKCVARRGRKNDLDTKTRRMW